jgi:hypothetical protein
MSYTLRQKKVALIAKAIREISERNMKRKLQDIEPTSTPTTNSTTEEGKNAEDPAEEIPADTKVSEQGTNTNKPNAGIQVVKFHNFKTEGKKINFGIFFFFLNRPIARTVVFRLRVTVGGSSRRIRNLEVEKAESVPSTCEISDKDKSLAGTVDETGKKVDYDCEATTKELNAAEANITLNTDVPMTVKDKDGNSEPVDFDNVNFKGNSSNQASNLQEVGDEDPEKNVNLKDVDLVGGDKNSFTLKGTVEPADGLKKGDTFDLTVPTSSQTEPATVTCKVTQISSDGETTMECKSDSDLNSKMADFHNVATSVNGNPLDVEVKGGVTNQKPVKTGDYYDPAENGITNRFYRKSSSGLSGGAIAGIVIACVVALAAASIAAIMLRKPAPPIDNTTIVGLKTVENI